MNQCSHMLQLIRHHHAYRFFVFALFGLPIFVSSGSAMGQSDASNVNVNSPVFMDVYSSDWGSGALRDLNNRYQCIEGFPDGSFRGNERMTRYQFVAGLNSCLASYDREMQGRLAQLVTRDDLAILFRALSTLFEERNPEQQ